MTTQSSNLNLTLMDTGSQSNAWGGVLNTQVFANIDQALGSAYPANVAGNTDVTLSQTNALNLVHNLTGLLTGSINYIFPASAGRLVIVNNATSGAFTITVKQSGGTGVVVPQGQRQLVLLDPSNTTAYLPANPTGFLSSTLTDTNIFVGNSSNVATGVALSGDATLADTGALTLATVNSNVGTFTNATVQADAKGRILAVSSGSGTTSNYRITDTNNLSLSTAPTQTNVGSPRSISIPTTGQITWTLSGEVITTTTANDVIIGLRIGSTNYWPTSAYGAGTKYNRSFYDSTGPETSIISSIGSLGGNIGGTPGALAVGSTIAGISIEGSGIPTGTQTIQVIAAKGDPAGANPCALRGDLVTTIINIKVEAFT